MFVAPSRLFTRCPVDSRRILVWYSFYFLRFLLICHWKSLNLTYTLKWFLFGKYFRTPSQNNSENKVFRVFSSQNCKNVFHNFFLDFWANASEFLSNIFCWLFGPRRLFLALRDLRRIASIFLGNFILQVTNPLFLKNSWFCGENHGLHFWAFVAENKSSISNG